MIKAVLRELYLLFREHQIQRELDALTDQLWEVQHELRRMKRESLPEKSRARRSTAFQELEISVEILIVRIQLNQIKRELGRVQGDPLVT